MDVGVVAEVRHNRYRDMQRSREGEIKIIGAADHENKKVKNMLTFGVTGPHIVDSSRK